jgi:opacity protein-like surface antigen
MSLLSGTVLSLALVAGAQAPATAPADSAAAPAAAAAQAPAAAPDPKPWRVGPMDVSGFLDGYYSYNSNDPSEDNNGKINDLYNFNDKTNQWALNGAKLTLSHDPAPIGARVDLVYGRINKLVNAPNQLEFVEQAYLSIKPPKAKGFELDLGKWVTSAGAEVIESKDNWNYSRSILFAWAMP